LNSVSCHCAALTDGRRSGVPRRGNRGRGRGTPSGAGRTGDRRGRKLLSRIALLESNSARAASRRPRCLVHIAISRLRPQQRHTTGAGPGVEDRPCHQPGGPYTAATTARAPHEPQHVAHCALRAIEAHQFRHGEGSFGGTAGCALLPAFFVSAREFSPASNSAPGKRSGALFVAALRSGDGRRSQVEQGRGAAPIPFRLPSISCRPRRGAASTIRPGCLAALPPDGRSNRRRSASRREKSLRLW
jgi:hypothetical protein